MTFFFIYLLRLIMSIFYIDCLRLFEGKEEREVLHLISVTCELKYIYIHMI